MFDINKYNGNYAMHCKTKAEAIEFCYILFKNKRTWSTGTSYLEYNFWDSFKEDTIYLFNKGMYGSIKSEDYIILEWEDFIEYEDSYDINKLRNGDIIKLKNEKHYLFLKEFGTLISQDKGILLFSDLISNDIIEIKRPETRFGFEIQSWHKAPVFWKRKKKKSFKY